ncbi:MAG: efflux RND transporter periplasmic adaptor subunit [Bacteroidales bacterium]
MKKYIVFALGVALLAGCSSDKQSRLEALLKERSELDKEIATLQTELNETNGHEAKKPTSVKVNTLKPEVFQHFIEAQGMVESDNNVFIPGQAGGIVKRIYVEEGDRVEKGQVLAQIDDEILRKNREELLTGLELATTVYERQKRLWDKKIGSEIQFLEAKNTKESLENKLAALNEQLELYKIVTPIAGVVDAITLKEGEMAAAGFGAVRVVQPGKLKIAASLSESYAGNVQVNDTVKVKFPSANKESFHRISSISQVIDPNSRTFDFEIRLPGQMEAVKPNMMAVLTINDYTRNDALTVPLNVVQKESDSQYLFVAVEKEGEWIAERRTVTTGKYYNNRVEILSGLDAGDKVIITGYGDLGSGQKVAVKE